MPPPKPLDNYKILVTRAAEQAGEVSEKLISLGATPIEVPLISIGPPDSWEPLDQALQNLSQYDWLVFASANAVDSCLKRLAQLCLDTSELKQVKLAAIGPSTSALLAEHGLPCAFRPSKFIGESLVAEFPGYPNLSALRIFWPRTNIGRNYIVEELRTAGAKIDIVTCYKTSGPADSKKTAEKLLQLLTEKQIDIITLMSAQTARNLAALLKTHEHLLTNVLVASIGPETTKAALEELGKVDIEAKQYTVDGLLESIAQFVSKPQPRTFSEEHTYD
jgi:uroporphyrinogen III methyltransferase/synthase